MVLQSSGVIKLSDMHLEFNTPYKLSAMSNVVAGIPTNGVPTGRIKFSDLYNKAASVPTISTIPTQNISTNSATASGSINIASYISDTYGTPFTYSAPSYTTGKVSSASLSGTIVSYNIPSNTFANTASITITVTNRFGKSATLSIPLYITGNAILSTDPITQSISKNQASVYLPSFFTEYSATGLTYTITNNPQSNATISNSYLYVQGNNRNKSYTITVQATNSYSQNANISIGIIEYPPPPSTNGNIPDQSCDTGNYSLTVSSYFSGIITSYSVTYNLNNNLSIDNNGNLSWSCSYRNTKYQVNITASNSGGSATQVFYITESAQPAYHITIADMYWYNYDGTNQGWMNTITDINNGYQFGYTNDLIATNVSNMTANRDINIPATGYYSFAFSTNIASFPSPGTMTFGIVSTAGLLASCSASYTSYTGNGTFITCNVNLYLSKGTIINIKMATSTYCRINWGGAQSTAPTVAINKYA